MTSLTATMWIERDEGEVRVTVRGRLRRGYPALGPSYFSGSEPGEPDSADYEGAEDDQGREVDLTDGEIERAEELLADEAADAARDEARWGRE